MKASIKNFIVSLLLLLMSSSAFAGVIQVRNATSQPIKVSINQAGVSFNTSAKTIAPNSTFLINITGGCGDFTKFVQLFFSNTSLYIELNGIDGSNNCNKIFVYGYDSKNSICQESDTYAIIKNSPNCD